MPEPSESSAPSTKSSEGPAPGKAPQEASGTVGGLPGGAEPLSLVPRSRSASRDAATPAGPEGGAPASFTDFMQWMKMFAGAAEAPPVETAKPGARLQRSTLPKTQRKFQRFDREPGVTDKPGAAPESENLAPGGAPPENIASENTSPNALDPEKPAVYNSQPVPIALTGGSSGRRTKPVVERRPYFWLAMQLGAFLLLIVVFFLGRASVAKPAVTARNAAPAAPSAVAEGSTVGVLGPDAAKLIDEAMAAEQDHKFDQAASLLQKVQKDHPHVHDLDYRLALLALESNDAAKALPLLNLSISQGEQEGAAYKFRGTILNRRGGGNRGMNDFENATLVDPFSAENFFFWGEALRKAGKPQAALLRLQQAMDRLREPALETQYRLKIRLTQIELGREQEFAKEMAEQLAENPPVPDWLLTAAAIELHRGDFPAAAGFLDKAATYMDKEIFMLRMRDYFFYSFRFEKPLARFFAFANTAAAATPAATPGFGSMDAPAPTDLDAKPSLQAIPAPTPAALPTATP